MKILYILHITKMHGSIISVLNTIKGLKQKGVEPIFVLPSGEICDEELSENISDLGGKVYYLPLVQSIISKNSYRTFSCKQKIRFFYDILCQKHHCYKQLLNIVREERPVIIHTNVGVIHEGFWVAKRLGIPHVFHIREYQDKDFGWKILPTKKIFCLMLKTSNVITITDALKEYFGLRNSNNAVTIYNGIYSQNRTSLNFPKERYFFCASRISKEKGYIDVISAFARFSISHPNYKLLLAGDGNEDYIKKLKNIIRQHSCEEKIVFLGKINNVYDYMKHARALIVGSYYEGFGRMTAEAAFAGCFVIGRNTGGTKEILDKIEGSKFENIEELIAAMNNIAKLQDDEYEKIVNENQNQAVKLFSIEQNRDNTYNFYKKIVG